jgi:hypothetical protein
MNNKELFCQCLHEIENDLPRTKFCFMACRDQGMIMHKRYVAELAKHGIEWVRGMVISPEIAEKVKANLRKKCVE